MIVLVDGESTAVGYVTITMLAPFLLIFPLYLKYHDLMVLRNPRPAIQSQRLRSIFCNVTTQMYVENFNEKCQENERECIYI